MKTFIRWYGNKSKYIKFILLHFPISYNKYVEPFVGSGALFLTLQPKKWIINDLNTDLINCWKKIRSNPKIIIKHFMQFENKFESFNEQEKLNYCRKQLNAMLYMKYSYKRAALFMLVKFCAYMGFILINNKYKITALDSKIYHNKKLYFLSEKYYNNLKEVSQFLNNSNGIISNNDYKDILKNVNENDFIFIDPPYIQTHEFNYNYNQILNNKFQDDLFSQLQLLDYKKVKWLLTQPDTPYVRKLFIKYKIYEFSVYRGHSHKYDKELVIKNY